MMFEGKRTKADILSGVDAEIVKSKFVDNNTVEYTTADGRRVIRLHDTDIITFMPNGKIILNSGGWKTMTTKNRINGFLDGTDDLSIGISQVKGMWYVEVSRRGAEIESEHGCKYRPWNVVQSVPFVDGIEIYRGRVLSKYVKKSDAIEAEKKKLDKMVDKYMQAVQEAIKEGKTVPDDGDCWYCLMQTQSGETLGDAFGDHSHIMSHIKEGYVPAALIWNAVKESGYRPEFWLHPQLMGSRVDEISKKDSVPMRAVRKYVKRRLGMAQ